MSEIQQTEIVIEEKAPVIIEGTLIRFSSNSRYLTAFAARDIPVAELAELYRTTAGDGADPAKVEQAFIVSLDQKGLIYIVPQALIEFFPAKPVISFTIDQKTHNYCFVNDDLSFASTPDELKRSCMQYSVHDAKPGYTVSPGNSTKLHTTELSKTAGGNLSHDEVAGRVRMLTREQLNHESVCCMARDRIKWLAHREAALEALLRESAALFRTYEESHRKRGPEHLEKAERNAEIATRIENVLGHN